MERCLGFVSSVMMMTMMMGYMYDENDNNYLPYMICMYVHGMYMKREPIWSIRKGPSWDED